MNKEAPEPDKKIEDIYDPQLNPVQIDKPRDIIGGRDGTCVVAPICGTYIENIEVICSAKILAIASSIGLAFHCMLWDLEMNIT